MFPVLYSGPWGGGAHGLRLATSQKQQKCSTSLSSTCFDYLGPGHDDLQVVVSQLLITGTCYKFGFQKFKIQNLIKIQNFHLDFWLFSKHPLALFLF